MLFPYSHCQATQKAIQENNTIRKRDRQTLENTNRAESFVYWKFVLKNIFSVIHNNTAEDNTPAKIDAGEIKDHSFSLWS